MKRTRDEITVTEGSGNVFADLGFPDPEEALAKAQLASHIRQIIKRHRLSHTAAAELMGIDRAQVSTLLDGRVGSLSSERLAQLLTVLERGVERRRAKA